MKHLLNISFTLTALLVSGCGPLSQDSTSTQTNPTVQITHTVTIDSVKQVITEAFTTNPQRVATYNFGVLDMMDTIGLDIFGIVKLGLAQASVPLSLSEYNDSRYENIGTLFEPDYTALDFFNPQLIILDGRSAALYPTFKTRYPQADILDATLTTYNVSTQEAVANNIALIFPEASSLIEAQMDSIINDIGLINEVAREHEALFVLSNGDALTAYGDTGRYNSLHTDFGFKTAVEGIVTEAQHGTSINKEYLTTHDPEIIFMMDRAAAIGETSGYESFLNDPLVKTLSSYENNQIFPLSAQAWYTVSGGFTSTRQMILDIDQFTNVLS